MPRAHAVLSASWHRLWSRSIGISQRDEARSYASVFCRHLLSARPRMVIISMLQAPRAKMEARLCVSMISAKRQGRRSAGAGRHARSRRARRRHRHRHHHRARPDRLGDRDRPPILIRGADTMSKISRLPRPSAAPEAGAPSDQTGNWSPRCSAARKSNGRRSLSNTAAPTSRRRWSCSRRHALGLRRSTIRHGAVLLPERPQGLSRYLVLPGSRTALSCLRRRQQILPVLAAYVIAHEIGHHLQNLLGILPKVQHMQKGMDKVEANQLQVRVELQADCFAGMWAHHSQKDWQFIEPAMWRPPCRPLPLSATTGYKTQPGLCGARRLYPRLLGAAHTLVHERDEVGVARELRHL